MPSFPEGTAHRSTVATATSARTRLTPRRFLSSFGLFLLLITLLASMNLVVLAPNAGLAARVLGRPHYYLALGDSISFGFQPTLNFTHGYADDVFAGLRKDNITHLVNLACLGETSASMRNGACPYRNLLKQVYSGSQLDTAVGFLKEHRGEVNPVTLSIGGNDVLPNQLTCGAFPDPQAALDAMDGRLMAPSTGILPRLAAALEVAPGERAGDLILLNYYNPYAADCPEAATFIHDLNDHLAQDATQFRIPIVDVYNAFGGDTDTASNVCQLTWYCDKRFDHDVHPTTAGYQRIAEAVDGVLGY
jgi:lysophospholipase L1-like esterase